MSEKELDNRTLLVAEKLKQLRKDKGFSSYEDFAFEFDLPRMQYWRMEKGTNFTFQSLLKLLDIHQMTVEEFFKGIS